MERPSVIGILGEYCCCSIAVWDTHKKCLALQGAFVEHKTALEKLPVNRRLEVLLVKTPEELERCDALIIPGGGRF